MQQQTIDLKINLINGEVVTWTQEDITVQEFKAYILVMLILSNISNTIQSTFRNPNTIQSTSGEDLRINLARNKIGDEGAKAIAEALQNGNCPQGLHINLYDNQIGAEGAKAFAEALQSGNCPQGLHIDLSSNQIGDEGAKAIAKALQNGNCPQGLQIDLSYNQIGDEGAKAIAEALRSGNCPQGLRIDLSGNDIGAKGIKAFAEALQSGKCPQGLRIDLSFNQIGDERAKEFLIDSLETNTTITEFNINCNQDQRLRIDQILKRNKMLLCITLKNARTIEYVPSLQLPLEIKERILENFDNRLPTKLNRYFFWYVEQPVSEIEKDNKEQFLQKIYYKV